MIAKGDGKIINICSMMSELGRETVSAYAAAKGGLKMLTKNIAPSTASTTSSATASAPATSPPRRPHRCARSSPTAAVTRSTSSSSPRPPQAAGATPRTWGPRRLPGFRRVGLRQRPHPLCRRRHPRIHWKAASISVAATAHIRFHPLVFHLSCGEIRIGFGFYQAKQSVFHRKLEIER